MSRKEFAKITFEDIDIASKFFDNEKHEDEFVANVVITKMLYDILFSGLLLISIIKLGYYLANKYKFNKDDIIVPTSIFGGILLCLYIWYDCYSVYNLSYFLLGYEID